MDEKPEDARSGGQLNVISFLKDTISIVGGIAAISYVAGFVISTTYLLGWGILSLSLVHSRYVSAGLCFFIVLSLTLAPAYYSAPALLRIVQNAKLKKAYKSVVFIPVFLVGLIGISLIVIVLLGALPAQSSDFVSIAWSVPRDVWHDGGGLLLILDWYGALFFVGILLRLLVSGRAREVWFLSIPVTYLVIGVVVLLLLIATQAYAMSIYPNIDPAVGGSRVRVVRLLFNSPMDDFVRELGAVVPEGETGIRFVDVAMIDQTDKSYIVIVRDKSGANDHAAEIDKGIVKAIVVTREQQSTTRPDSKLDATPQGGLPPPSTPKTDTGKSGEAPPSPNETDASRKGQDTGKEIK